MEGNASSACLANAPSGRKLKLASATCRLFTTLPRGAPVFAGQEAPRGAPLPAAQWAEQWWGVLCDSGPAGQVPSSIPRRVSAHPQNCDTYSHCGLLSRLAPQIIRRGQLELLFQFRLLELAQDLLSTFCTKVFLFHTVHERMLPCQHSSEQYWTTKTERCIWIYDHNFALQQL